MRDDNILGGLVATVIAAPAVIVCCGGGGILYAAVAGALGGWFSGLGGLATLLVAVAAALTVHAIRRARRACPAPASGTAATEERTHG